MKIFETKQGNIQIYPWDAGRPEPKGIETSAIALSPEKFDEMLETMDKFRTANPEKFKRQRIGGYYL